MDFINIEFLSILLDGLIKAVKQLINDVVKDQI